MSKCSSVENSWFLDLAIESALCSESSRPFENVGIIYFSPSCIVMDDHSLLNNS